MRRRQPSDDGVGALFDPSKVDLVSLAPDGTTIRLYVVNDSAWTGSDEQLNSLQEKVHNYVGYAVDGQMLSAYAEAAGLPWQIVIDCQAGKPDARSAQFLTQIGEAVRRYGGDMVIEGS